MNITNANYLWKAVRSNYTGSNVCLHKCTTCMLLIILLTIILRKYTATLDVLNIDNSLLSSSNFVYNHERQGQ